MPPDLDPLGELELFLSAASETERDSVRELFIARARTTFVAVTRRLADAARLLEAQERELERSRR